MNENEERLSGALQENVLTALCFDDRVAPMVRACIKVQLFESSLYKEIAGHAIDYLDRFGKPIGDHLADELETVLKGDDRRKAAAYERELVNLYAARERVNGDYVVSQLQKFVRGQTIKSAIVTAAEAMRDGKVDEAEVAMQAGLTSQINLFEPGIRLSDPSQALSFLHHTQEAFATGIPCLDKYGVGPSRKTLFLVLAALNRGKSWWLMHLAKWAMLQRHSVVHITLEMSQEKVALRYMQSLFSLTKRQAAARVPQLITGDNGTLLDIDFAEIVRPSLEDRDIDKLLRRRVTRELSRRPPLIIKEFPTGGLTLSGLRAYLDGLERFHKVTPDLVVIDYADIMAIDSKDRREGIGANMIGLRGIAVERNCAIATASQTNREGINAKLVDERNLSEDVSKGFTADTVVSYNQTEMEHSLSLARLYVSKHRDDEARMMALIAQSYAMGQFCLDSVPLQPQYWNIIGASARDQEGADADREVRR